jgi:hypothetical protein
MADAMMMGIRIGSDNTSSAEQQQEPQGLAKAQLW